MTNDNTETTELTGEALYYQGRVFMPDTHRNWFERMADGSFRSVPRDEPNPYYVQHHEPIPSFLHTWDDEQDRL